MARYGYGISVSGSRTAIVASAAPAPSGIPTATTTIVNISVPSYGGFSGNFQKFVTDSWEGPDGESALIFTGTRWEINYLGDVFSFNTLASQTVNFIPQTNWSVPTTITVVA